MGVTSRIRTLYALLLLLGCAEGFSFQKKGVPAPPPISVCDETETVALEPRGGRTAVLLNTNARAVTKDLKPLAVEVFGSSNVFFTATEEEAKLAAETIAKNLDKYDKIVPVGGDGTLSSTINFLCQSIGGSTDEAMDKLPIVGYVPMGTGNGVGSVIGGKVSGGFWFGRKKRKLRRLRRVFERLARFDGKSDNNGEILEIPMLQVSVPPSATGKEKEFSGDLCFFAGVGFDSLMLNDYKSTKEWSQKTGFLKDFLGSVAGYCVALVTKTLPKCVLSGAHEINLEIKSKDPDCLWVDHRRGDVAIPCSRSLLYRGKAGIAAAATSPYYGGGMRLFPFARLTTDKMHLRVGRIHPLTGFLNIPRIFAGSYRDKSNGFGCLDFIADDFDFRVEAVDKKESRASGYPFQHSGESFGEVSEFNIRVVPTPVRFLSLMDRRIEVSS